jgi:hypothetical protein
MIAKGTLSLKEWAVVCEALADGDQVLLLRKGGVGEKRGFEVAGTEFLLFPSFEHQHGAGVRPEHRRHFEAAVRSRPPAGRLHVDLLARVEGAVALTEPGEPADAAGLYARTEDLHVYTPELVAERVAYRPQAPLVGVVLDVRPLRERLDLVDERRYAGCRSWVDLPRVDVEAGEPAVAPARLRAALDRLREIAPAPVAS